MYSLKFQEKNPTTAIRGNKFQKFMIDNIHSKEWVF